MSLRKEQILLIATAAVLGGIVALEGGADARPVQLSPKTKDYQRPAARKDLFVPPAVPKPERGRDLFQMPTPDAPLPPKILALPALPLGPVLAPLFPPAPGVASLYLLRQDSAKTTEHTFAEAGGDGNVPNGNKPAAAAAPPATQGAVAPTALEQRDQAKLKYDWLDRTTGSRIWGYIRNQNKFDLKHPVPDEPLLFHHYNLATDKPIGNPYEPKPEEIVDFGFAPTLHNRIEVRKRTITRNVADLQKREDFVLWLLAEAKTSPSTYAVAEEQAKLYVEVAPNEPRGHELVARVYREAGRLEDELKLYRELLKPDSKQRGAPFVWRGIGLLEARLGLYRDAEEHLREAVKLGAKDSRDTSALALFLVERGRPDEAVDLAAAAQKNAPSSGPGLVEARVAGFTVALARGDLAAAREAHDKLKSAAGEEDPQVHHLKGALAYAAGDMAAAEAEFTTATQSESISGASHIGLGAARAVLGKFNEARSSLELAAELDPLLRHLAFADQAFLMERTKNNSEALARAEAAWQVDPTDVYVRYQLGRQRRLNAQPGEAEKMLEEALAQRHDFVEALGEMALAKLARVDAGDLDGLEGLDAAARYARKATELDATRGKSPFYAELLGFVLCRRGDFEEARKAFHLALERGDSPYAKTFLALIEYRQNHVSDALSMLKGLREDPKYPPDYRDYAAKIVKEIEFHRSLRSVTDRFEQQRNWWTARVQGGGVEPNVAAGRVVIKGKIKGDKPVALRFDQREANESFISANVTLIPGTDQGRWLGLEISDDRDAGTAAIAGFRARIGINKGGVAFQVFDGPPSAGKEKASEPVVLETGASAGQPVRLGIEVRKGGEQGKDVFLVFTANQKSQEVKVTRWSTVKLLHVDLFVEGSPNDSVDATFKDFELIRR